MRSTIQITIELCGDEAAAFDMLRTDCANADPGANWNDDSLAKSMLLTILEDDLAMHRPDRIN